jgi:hypothetical protein
LGGHDAGTNPSIVGIVRGTLELRSNGRLSRIGKKVIEMEIDK